MASHLFWLFPTFGGFLSSLKCTWNWLPQYRYAPANSQSAGKSWARVIYEQQEKEKEIGKERRALYSWSLYFHLMAVLCPRRVQTAGQRFIRPIAKVKKDEDWTLEKKRRGEKERERKGKTSRNGSVDVVGGKKNNPVRAPGPARPGPI